MEYQEINYLSPILFNLETEFFSKIERVHEKVLNKSSEKKFSRGKLSYSRILENFISVGDITDNILERNIYNEYILIEELKKNMLIYMKIFEELN